MRDTTVYTKGSTQLSGITCTRVKCVMFLSGILTSMEKNLCQQISVETTLMNLEKAREKGETEEVVGIMTSPECTDSTNKFMICTKTIHNYDIATYQH